MCTPTLWEQGTVILISNVSYFTYHIKLPSQGNTSDCSMYACLVIFFYIIFMHIAIISHNRLLGLCWKMLQLNTPKYTANVSSRPFKSISLSGYGGKVSSPNVV